MKYTASAIIRRKIDLNKTALFFPVIKFSCKEITDCYYINLPQETRNEALKIARKHISNIGK